MSRIEVISRLRKEQDILERLKNVERLIQMETTLMTVEGAERYRRYKDYVRSEGRVFGQDLLTQLREEIQMQLLSITALCYGDNPDIGEPCPMLEWKSVENGVHPADRFHEVWDDCLEWNG